MKFNICYDLVSLAVLLVVTFKYFVNKRFPIFSNRFFGLLLILGDLDLLFDIISSILISDIIDLPVFASYLFNGLFYLTQFILSAAILLFLIALITKNKKVNKKIFIYASIPLVIFIIVFLIGLPTGQIFIITENFDYLYGPLSFITYACAGLYLVATIITLLVKGDCLNRNEKVSMWALLLFTIVFTGLQYFFPTELLTGSAIAISFLIMFFTIEDPQYYLDSVTGVFTGDAMKQIFDVNYTRKHNFHLAVIKMHGLHNIHMLYGRNAGNDALKHLSNFLLTFKDSWSYRPGDALFIVSFKKEKELDDFVEKYEVFKKDPQLCDNVMLKPRYTAMIIKDANFFKSTRELMAVVENAFDDDNIVPIKLKVNYLTEAKILKYRSNVAIEDAVKNDLPNGEHFFMCYQPIFSTKRNKYVSAEALVRYQNEPLGLIKPSEFVPIVEHKGLATQLDDIVIKMVFNDIKKGVFEDLGLENIHINLSAATFSSKVAIESIISLTQEYDIDPHFIIFEITETASILSEETLIDTANLLISSGFGLALDDFGTGYANIKRAAKLPFTHVKLDRILIQETPNIVKDIVSLFRGLNMHIIAEGIETLDQKELIVKNNVDLIQGFFYSRAVLPEEVRTIIKRNIGD